MENSEQLTIPAFGYELIREVLIPELLGKETPEILYWAGKHLARKFPLISMEEVISFFEEAGWGLLRVLKQDKNGMELEISSPIISRHLKLKTDSCYKLEAGFLAEQIQTQMKVRTEAYEEIIKKTQSVRFILRWDMKDTVTE
ncbi:YslB family protein [Bacillus sp. FJAT-49736]|nr:YslB family protein [Bacillus sp. FJAT-49736]